MESLTIDYNIYIYAPAYNIENSSDALLHLLCHCINQYSANKSYLIPQNQNNFIINSNWNTPIYGGQNINYDWDVVIYNENIYGNPVSFKNVIRWIIYAPKNEIYESYSSDDTLIFYKYALIHNFFNYFNEKILHQDLIDFFSSRELQKVNVGTLIEPSLINYEAILAPIDNIHFEDLNKELILVDGYYQTTDYVNKYNSDIEKFNIENTKNILEIIKRKIFFDRTRFTDPFLSMTNETNGIPTNSFVIGKKITEFSVEIDFLINNFNFDYQDITDLCYDKMNNGPRIEILGEERKLGITIGNRYDSAPNDFTGFSFNTHLEENKLYKLVFSVQSGLIIAALNDEIFNFNHSRYEPFLISQVLIGGGFDSSRNFNSGKILRYKLFNYKVFIAPNRIILHLKNYDRFKLGYPRKLFQSYIKSNNDNFNIGNNIISDFTISFNFSILNINDNKNIFAMNSLQILNNKGNIEVHYHHNLLWTTNIISLKKYEFIFSVDKIERKALIIFNNNISILNINHLDILLNNFFYENFVENLCITNYSRYNELTLNDDKIKLLRNDFHCFGFLKIDKLFLHDNERLIQNFEANLICNNRSSIDDYLPHAVESNQDFIKLVFNHKIHKIFEQIFGVNNYYYNGSDCKIYGSDTNWHCDRKTKNLHLKIAFYLDQLDESKGALSVLPGSHHQESNFTKLLNKNAIPLFLGPGGFKNNFISFNDRNVPKVTINNYFGDVVVFNLALFHCAFNNQINKKMIAMNWAQKYEDNNDEEKIECINSDFYILQRYFSINEKAIPIKHKFYNFLKNTEAYDKYFKDAIENDNKLDYYQKLLISNPEHPEIKEFVKNNNNTNQKKINLDIFIYNQKF